MSSLKQKISTAAIVFIVKRALSVGWLRRKAFRVAVNIAVQKALNKLSKEFSKMSDWKSVATIIAIAAIAIAVGFLAGYSTKKVPPPETIYVDVPITVRDTVKVEVPAVSYPGIPAKPANPTPTPAAKDSLTTPESHPPLSAAYLDTVLRSGDNEYGRLMLAYRMPLNVFDLDFFPSPRQEVIITKYIYKETPWYSKPWVAATAGLAVGVAVGRFR